MNSNPYTSHQKCQWCSRQTQNIHKLKSCSHIICDRCYIKDSTCQSDCPLCWEINIKQFLNVNRICSGCCTGIKAGDRSFKCSHQHLHCSDCTSDGCLLCQFHELKACNNKIYRDHSAKAQRALYACQSWQKKYEESPISQHSTFLQDNNELLMNDDNESENISGLSKSKHSQNNSRENVDCMICLEQLGTTFKRLDHCKHCFHQSCIDQWFQSSGKQSCPTCGYLYGISKGPQPANGQMLIKYLPTPLPSFESIHSKHGEGPTIEITYIFPSGLQGPLNPNPNRPYTGTIRKAYLPNNVEGREILSLLQRAFNDQHIFTIGRSSTTGEDNVVTWNDIHHKTSISGGPQRFGYPDPTYLFRVRQELADKGYKQK